MRRQSRQFLIFRGNVDNVVLNALRVVFVVHIRLHRDEVDESLEFVFGSDGEEQRMRIAVELCLNVFHGTIKVRTRSVHLVDESYTGNIVLVHLAPHRFRLGLYARNRAEYRDGAVENTEGTFNFGGEVNVSGGVDKIDLLLDSLKRTFFSCPVAGNCRRRNSNAAFAFLFHPVGYSRTFVNFADFMNYAAIEQDTFRAGCFTRVDVRRYTDVSGIFERSCSIGRIFF